MQPAEEPGHTGFDVRMDQVAHFSCAAKSSVVLVQLSVKKSLKVRKCHMLQKFMNDECGLIISAELVLVLTICVLGVIVGLSSVVVAVNEELLDVAHAIGSFNQSYCVPGFLGCLKGGNPISCTFGSRNTDTPDDCDCASSCDMIAAGVPLNSVGG